MIIGTSSLEQPVALLAEAADRRDLFSGGQLYVSVDGVPLADVGFGRDGVGTPMSPDLVGPAYCAMKPIVACAIAALCDRASLQVDDRVGELLPAFADHWLAEVQVAELLTHVAGLHEEEGVHIGLMTPTARQAMVAERLPPEGWSRHADLGYSVYSAWHVLGLVIEAVSGKALTDTVAALVFDPLSIRDEMHLGMSECDYEATRDRLCINIDLQGSRPVPLLVERTDLSCVQWNPGFGGYTSMRALGAFYEALVTTASGTVRSSWLTADTVRTFTSPQVSWNFDETFQRACQYGYGFMVDMSAHHLGEACSPQSFGHTGNVGLTLGFADPVPGLVVALRCNGLIDDREVAFALRRQVVGSVYEAIGVTH